MLSSAVVISILRVKLFPDLIHSYFVIFIPQESNDNNNNNNNNKKNNNKKKNSNKQKKKRKRKTFELFSVYLIDIYI